MMKGVFSDPGAEFRAEFDQDINDFVVVLCEVRGKLVHVDVAADMREACRIAETIRHAYKGRFD